MNMLKNALIAISLTGFVLLFSGCPFSGSVPIDDGTVVVSDKLVGTWIKPGDVEEVDPTYFVTSKTDKYHLSALKIEYSTTDAEYDTTKYNLTLSNVAGDVFANVIESGTSTYYYYKFGFDESSNKITMNEVSDYIKETFDTSKSLKDFIAANKSLSFFFTNSTDTYIRK